MCTGAGAVGVFQTSCVTIKLSYCLIRCSNNLLVPSNTIGLIFLFVSFGFVQNTKEVKADKKVLISMINNNTRQQVLGEKIARRRKTRDRHSHKMNVGANYFANFVHIQQNIVA